MNNQPKKLRALAWPIALLMTALMFLVIILFLDFRYAQNDDIGILRSFMGYETGTPAHFSIFVHGLLAWPLYWLACTFPTVAWFSVLQIALLALACVLIAKSIIQCFVKHGRSFWLGTLFAALFLLAFALDSCAHITFTQTAALLGAAAVLQIFSIDYEQSGDGAVVRGMLLALVPVVMAYCLRQVTALPILAFCGLAFIYCAGVHFGFGKQAKRSLKPLLISLAVVAVAMGGLVGARAVELAQDDISDYLAWQNARASLLDYYGVSDLPQELMDEIGWTENTRQLADNYFFLEPDVSTEALEAILAYKRSNDSQDLGERLRAAFWAIGERARTDTVFMRSTVLALLVLLLCVAGGLMKPDRRAARLVLLGAALLLFIVLLAYLGMGGRLPLRAMLMLFLPFTATLFAVMPACLPQMRARMPVLAAAAVLCCAATGWYLSGILPMLTPDQEAAAEVGDPAAVLDEYALYDPDMLFIHDLTLSIDSRLFPNVSDGIPTNVTCWGGWNLRSPASVEQFANYGFDLSNFSAEDLLSDNVLIASGVVDPPPMLVLDYLRERVDPNVDCDIYGEDGGVYFFQFYVP